MILVNHGVLSACCAFASKDESRPHIACVAILPDRRVVATDGHMLVVFYDAASEAPPKTIRLQIAPLAKLLAKASRLKAVNVNPENSRATFDIGGVSVTADVGVTTSQEYPPIDQVMTPHGGIAPFTANASLLSRLLAVQDAARSTHKYRRRSYLSGGAPPRLVAGGGLNPVRWDFHGETGDGELVATVVMMPMRSKFNEGLAA